MRQLKKDVKYENIRKGDYAFVKVSFRNGAEDVGLLIYLNDDSYPRYLTHNPMCGGLLLNDFIDAYGYSYTCSVYPSLAFHSTHLKDTLKVSMIYDSQFGAPHSVRILKDIPTDVPMQMRRIIGLVD